MFQPTQINGSSDLDRQIAALKDAFLADPSPDYATRIDRLDRLRSAVMAHKDRLIAAADTDFGGRHAAETFLIELYPILEGIHHNRKHLRRWMRPSRRRVPLGLLGSTARVHYQPLGVVGIIVPWNFPLFLALSPLAGAFAAGNRAMIKLSELAPQTADAVKAMLTEHFDPAEVTVVAGGPDVAAAFSALPFDHLLFTGSTAVGRKVMAAAAQNLTPVTLELGGKSPAVIHEDFDIKTAAARIAFGKGLNAGQACVAPDYVMVPQAKVAEFASALQAAITKLYPNPVSNPDFSSIISDTHRSRLLALVEDARAKGATVITVSHDEASDAPSRKLPFYILTGVTDDMTVMQEEIFGPILPVLGYDQIDDAVAYINDRDRPLALYYFDWNGARAKTIIRETHAGGMAINDVVAHVAVDDMPFGGIGPSGMGHYHGHEGFLTFSKAKSVLHKGRFNPTAFVQAPWGNPLFKAYRWFVLKTRG